MGDKSAIEWTEASWNPVMGCSRVSEGCRNCYAERQAIRIAAYRLNGVVKSTPAGPRWTGAVRLNPATWTAPLHWRRPRRIFVNSMSDLFHEKVPDEWIDRIFAVMALAPQHVYQVLTKRPERMRDYMAGDRGGVAGEITKRGHGWPGTDGPAIAWPLPNVWLGVSVEDQPTFDERWRYLKDTPAAIRWISYEPALAGVDFFEAVFPCSYYCDHEGEDWPNGHRPERSKLDWLVIGGESGPGARPFDLAWARSAIARCRAAGVPVFVKQLGAQPTGLCVPDCSLGPYDMSFRDRKGGDPSEWPQDLRVREYPR